MPKKKKTEEEQKQEQSLAEVPRTKEQFRLALRRKTRLYYDVQMMRLQAEGRLTKKSKNNQIELHPADKAKIAARVRDLQVAEDHALEDLDEHLQQVPFYQEVILPQRKGLYRGFGPRLASIIISSFDIEREEMPSQMWSFAGLAPEKAQRCKHCSVVLLPAKDTAGTLLYFHPKPQGNKCKFATQAIPETETFSSGKAAKPKLGEKLKYNAWLRTKLMGVMAEVLIKLGSRHYTCNHCEGRVTSEGVPDHGEVDVLPSSAVFEHKNEKDAKACGHTALNHTEVTFHPPSYWVAFYENYKHRKEQAGWGTSQGHRHWAAKRYMIKMLLLHIWREWRTFEKLPVRPSYQEQYLGHTHHASPAPKPQEPSGSSGDRDEDDILDMAVTEALEDEDAAQ